MSHKTQAKLVKTHIGRIILHLCALARDRNLISHAKGISREFSLSH